MDGLMAGMDRLYELYQGHFRELRADVIAVNRSLGSTWPEKTWMELLSRTDFERLITAPTDDPKVIQRWVRRLIRGHEHEFPELQVA
ncbi:MAG: hypothetical protein GX575_02180 [Candidatus Anammoximicrobium sp.]|nr:hypothetical protein [Candidatus Anammoximicrobium sp.]